MGGAGAWGSLQTRGDALRQEEEVTWLWAVLAAQELTGPENTGCSAWYICFAEMNENWLVITGFSWKDLQYHPSPQPLASVH